MSGTWREFGYRSEEIPHEPLDEATRQAKDLPRTLTWVPGGGVTQRPVFEPALKQYQNAYRATDPVFTDPARGEAWRTARRQALHLVLASISESEWAEALVLRGSMLMSMWFGQSARDPGDLDFVVVPAAWRIDEERTARMLDGIAEAAEAREGAVRFSARKAVVEDIWTYERVPGRRVVLPWSAPGLPGGHVQLDFVFNERLPQAPEPVELPGGATLLAATPGLSLAWKLMWLITDIHPQGKDLYDAVLLAERHPLSHELLQEVVRESGEWPNPSLERPIPLAEVVQAAGHAEWQHFVTEYPQFAERGQEFAERLVRAVAPAFEDTSEGGGAPRL
ncbi:nucleotidyl transferase AbiEii/AbiGii toxin family protein [Streptomyces sp. NPDC016566]|uniref:nucleotidyl transferase AbiEii/AbiGii toxin family protein n=1 Tax=unclassified Streptomyces TaxID=2593676 RepID=UPI0011A528DA|nr:nucleotidyl transferase AbiEii/AbiGii toxin family protein [Streptomyces sp. BK340]TVZ86652.1 nucleotidyltransferase AbiEii toxin of type IV toxin-antitoxin system [Streptomyces sp. BK340]